MYGTTNRSVSVLILILSWPTIITAEDITPVLEGASSNKSKINALQQIELLPIDSNLQGIGNAIGVAAEQSIKKINAKDQK